MGFTVPNWHMGYEGCCSRGFQINLDVTGFFNVSWHHTADGRLLHFHLYQNAAAMAGTVYNPVYKNEKSFWPFWQVPNCMKEAMGRLSIWMTQYQRSLIHLYIYIKRWGQVAQNKLRIPRSIKTLNAQFHYTWQVTCCWNVDTTK